MEKNWLSYDIQKLWFEASSLNSCIATKGYKYSPLPKLKKCNFWVSLFRPQKYVWIHLPVSLDAANASSSQYLSVHVCCLKSQFSTTRLVNIFPWFLMLILLFIQRKHQHVSNSLTFSSSNIIFNNYFTSCKSFCKTYIALK